RTSGKQNAWTAGASGAGSGGPRIVYDGVKDPIILIGSDNIEIKGFVIDARHTSAISATAFSGNINSVTISYCDFMLNAGDKGVAVDYGHTVSNLDVDFCRFIGQTTNTSDWFTVGEGSGAVGDGGSANIVALSYNQITNTMSSLNLDRNIKNIHYNNNWFGNKWDTSGTFTHAHNPYYGYLFLNKSDAGVSGKILGLTVTHNTFNDNIGGSAPNEFAMLVNNNVVNGDAGQWDQNCAVHYNTLLQNVDSGNFPIVGFLTPGSHASSITASYNYWANAPATPSSPGHISTKVDATPWLKAQVDGGVYAKIEPNTIQQVTDTLHYMTFDVDTRGSLAGATLLASQFKSTPVLEGPTPTAVFSNDGSAFFGLHPKSGLANINSITASFYVPGGLTLISAPTWWHDGSSWIAASGQAVTHTAITKVFNGITKTFAGAATVYLNSAVTPTVAQLTPSYFVLANTSPSASTSTSITLTTTTTVADDPGDSGSPTTTTSITETATTTSSTTTTVNGNGGTDTSTTTSLPADGPAITITPATLEYSSEDIAQAMSIANTGVGTLAWNINSDDIEYEEGEGWIYTITPTAGYIETTAETVTVTLNRKGLNPDIYSAILPVASNAGTVDVNIIMEVEEREFPVINVSPQMVVFLGNSDNKTITIANTLKSGKLIWEIQDPVYTGSVADWLTVSPRSGVIFTEPQKIRLGIARINMRPGYYYAVLPIKSSAGNRNLTVMLRVYEGQTEYPGLKVKPTFIFHVGPDKTEKIVHITNSKAGKLTWNAGQPTYRRRRLVSWINSVSPAFGSTTTEEDDLLISIDGTGLRPGLYRAVIPITSNAGKQKVTLFLFVPFKSK
ncbi:MAG: hypothetical protein GY868_09105, partial [Deltaproteobacteria bacterium]|nr:hypothetical protein [Deltaproteobacteria bacterium]